MRKFFAVLALSALAAACGDELTQSVAPDVEIGAPSYSLVHGALVMRYDPASEFCYFWDAAGELIPPSPCQIVYTPNPSGTFAWRIYAKGIPNNTGKAVHFGPTAYPQWLADVYNDVYGVSLVNGELPLCDYNVVADPALETLICTTNWRYTISAAGNGTLMWVADPGHSFTKPLKCPWCL